MKNLKLFQLALVALSVVGCVPSAPPLDAQSASDVVTDKPIDVTSALDAFATDVTSAADADASANREDALDSTFDTSIPLVDSGIAPTDSLQPDAMRWSCGDGRGWLEGDACAMVPGITVPCNQVSLFDDSTGARLNINATVFIGFEQAVPAPNGTFISRFGACDGSYWIRVRHPAFFDFDVMVRASMDRTSVTNEHTDEWTIRLTPRNASDASTDGSPDAR